MSKQPSATLFDEGIDTIPGLSAKGAKLLHAAGWGTLRKLAERDPYRHGRMTANPGISPGDERAVEDAVIAWREAEEARKQETQHGQ